MCAPSKYYSYFLNHFVFQNRVTKTLLFYYILQINYAICMNTVHKVLVKNVLLILNLVEYLC